MTLDMRIMLTDPVSAAEGWNPSSFALSKGD